MISSLIFHTLQAWKGQKPLWRLTTIFSRIPLILKSLVSLPEKEQFCLISAINAKWMLCGLRGQSWGGKGSHVLCCCIPGLQDKTQVPFPVVSQWLAIQNCSLMGWGLGWIWQSQASVGLPHLYLKPCVRALLCILHGMCNILFSWLWHQKLW